MICGVGIGDRCLGMMSGGGLGWSVVGTGTQTQVISVLSNWNQKEGVSRLL